MKLVQFPRSRFRSTLRLIIASVWPLVYRLAPQSPLIASEPLAKGIQDNSFFIDCERGGLPPKSAECCGDKKKPED